MNQVKSSVSKALVESVKIKVSSNKQIGLHDIYRSLKPLSLQALNQVSETLTSS